MKIGKFAFVIGAVASAALMVPATHAAGEQRGTQEGATDQRPAGERGARQQIGDQMLETRVKAALIGNDETKARNIEVEVRDGIVHLQGTVDSAAEADRAMRVVKGVDGVREVRGTLAPKPQR